MNANVMMIPTELAQRIINYLATKPYAEVAPIIQELAKASNDSQVIASGTMPPAPMRLTGDDGELAEEEPVKKT